MTRLAAFMEEHQIASVSLAKHAGLSPNRLNALSHGTAEPPLSEMRSVARACSELLLRAVRLTELFDLGDGET